MSPPASDPSDHSASAQHGRLATPARDAQLIERTVFEVSAHGGTRGSGDRATERASVIRSIDTLKLAEATGTGEAIFAALSAIEAFGSVVSDVQGPPPARIVLLTDGKQTVPTADGDDPRGAFTAARAAAAAKIPISTISFGTAYGQVEINGERQPVPAADDSMRRVADLSGIAMGWCSCCSRRDRPLGGHRVRGHRGGPGPAPRLRRQPAWRAGSGRVRGVLRAAARGKRRRAVQAKGHWQPVIVRVPELLGDLGDLLTALPEPVHAGPPVAGHVR